MTPVSNGAPGTPRRILVIDDDRVIHEVFRLILAPTPERPELDALERSLLDRRPFTEPVRFSVDCAGQGAEGLALVQSGLVQGQPYAVAFVDMRMPPGWDGMETIDRLRQVDRDLEIVICTAYSDHTWKDIVERFGDTGKLLVLKKPFDVVEVRQLALTLGKKWEMDRIARMTQTDLEAQVAARTRELHESLTRLGTVLDNAPIQIAFIGPDGTYRSWNRSSQAMFGFTPEEAVNRVSLAQLLKGPPKAAEILDQARQEKLFDGRALMLTRQKTVFPARLRIALIAGNAGATAGYAILIEDLTEKARADQAKHLAEKKLVHREKRIRQLEDELVSLFKMMETDLSFIGQSEPMREFFVRLEKAARTEATVLLEGETGTGKELAARAIHSLSPRKDKPFGVVDCAAIPAELLERELFGHEKGSFTGAHARMKGLIEISDGGTVFLDEIDALPLPFQQKLLRFIQEKEIKRIGSVERKKVDVRLVAASGRDLESLVKEQRFRADLYYRLNVCRIALAPLRERGEDVVLLARQFLKKAGDENRSFAPDAENLLRAYHWPGNIRELQNVVESATIFCDTQEIQAADLRIDPGQGVVPLEGRQSQLRQNQAVSLKDLVEGFEKKVLGRVFVRCARNQRRTARKLNLRLSVLQYKLRKHGLLGISEDPASTGPDPDRK